MMRFVRDFQKADKNRSMEFSLQFLLTVDIFITVFVYYSTVTPGIRNSKIYDLTFLCWMIMLTISIFSLNYTTARNFAKTRVFYRVLHLFMIVTAFYRYHIVLLPPFYVAYFSVELCYLMHGVVTQKMDFPGKWIAEFADKCQKEHDNQPEEDSKFFTSVAHEVVRKNCTIDEEFADDLFEYHTAYEDDLLPTSVFKSKGKSTFIV